MRLTAHLKMGPYTTKIKVALKTTLTLTVHTQFMTRVTKKWITYSFSRGFLFILNEKIAEGPLTKTFIFRKTCGYLLKKSVSKYIACDLLNFNYILLYLIWLKNIFSYL